VKGRLAESVAFPEVAIAPSTRASKEPWILVGTIEVGRLARSEMGGVAGRRVDAGVGEPLDDTYLSPDVLTRPVVAVARLDADRSACRSATSRIWALPGALEPPRRVLTERVS
jgi:hypothetical protein